MGQYAVFLMIAGLIFVGTLAVITGRVGWDPAVILPLCGAYAIAWLAGVATPGAPAGIGVREFVLLYLLSGVASDPEMTLAVILARVVNMAGDTLFFGGACLAKMADDHS
jgi:uncharacterized membrane protein YbhN (UPF0104 family)